MQAAIVTEAGRPPSLAEIPDPVPEPGETLVRLEAAALSQLARARASGTHYSTAGGFPFVAGVDGVGRTPDGARVYVMLPRAPHGTIAEATVAATDRLVKLPDPLDDITAAAIANPGMSSWAALRERARLAPGETVLVNGATGVSGRLAVRIARLLGAARIVATGRNRAVLATLGADATIALDDDPAALDAAIAAEAGQGVDVVLDYLWGPSASRLLAGLARSGAPERQVRFVQIGNVAGPEIPLPAHVLRSSGLALMGSGLGSVPHARLLAAIAGVFEAAARGELDIEATPVPLADLENAWPAKPGSTDGRTVFTTARPPT